MPTFKLNRSIYVGPTHCACVYAARDPPGMEEAPHTMLTRHTTPSKLPTSPAEPITVNYWNLKQCNRAESMYDVLKAM